MSENPVVYECEGDRMVGILHHGFRDTGVLMVVGGPQVRTGSHRLYVLQAREMARAGVPVFRFDARGMGDSTGASPGFEALTPDIHAALAAFQAACPSVQRVVLWGLCDGASAALLYLDDRDDPRIAGLCLLNPWVRTPATLARTQVRHYYLDRLRQGSFWKKLLSGKVAVDALSQGLVALRVSRRASQAGGSHMPGYSTRMARAWQRFDRPILIILSELDYTAREFIEATHIDPAWEGALALTAVTRLDIAAADHTFSGQPEAASLASACATWLRGTFPQCAAMSRVKA